MKHQIMLAMLVSFLCVSPLAISAQDQSCPQFSGPVKDRVAKRVPWLVNKTLQSQIAQKSKGFGYLIAFEQCHVLVTGILSDQFSAERGPFFLVDGVPLKSLIARHQGAWMMAVAPTESTGRMPDGNVLEITEHKWNLFHRNDAGNILALEAGKY